MDLISQLQQKMYEDIPLSQQMGMQVVAYEHDTLTLSASLKKNTNQLQTAFGGSIFSLATLACWAWLNVKLKNCKIDARIVIQRGHMDYKQLIEHDFIAICPPADEARFKRFLHILQRKAIARITLHSEVRCEGILSAKFIGEFVAEKN